MNEKMYHPLYCLRKHALMGLVFLSLGGVCTLSYAQLDSAGDEWDERRGLRELMELIDNSGAESELDVDAAEAQGDEFEARLFNELIDLNSEKEDKEKVRKKVKKTVSSNR